MGNLDYSYNIGMMVRS